MKNLITFLLLLYLTKTKSIVPIGMRKHAATRNLSDENLEVKSNEFTPQSDEETLKEEDESEKPSEFTLNEEDPDEQLTNFKKIAYEIQNYENEYKACIDDIPIREWDEIEVEQCTGKDLMKLSLDIQYETYKIISRTDEKIRSSMFKKCYTKAGTNLNFSIACDLIEKDSLEFLWLAIDFVKIIDINKDIYTVEYAELPLKIFEGIIEEFRQFSTEFFELLEEVENHKNVLLLRVKEYIDSKTKRVIIFQKNGGQTHEQIETKIEVTEVIDDNEERKLGRNLPDLKKNVVYDHYLTSKGITDKSIVNQDKKNLLEKEMHFFKKRMKGKKLNIKFKKDHWGHLHQMEQINLINPERLRKKLGNNKKNVNVHEKFRKITKFKVKK